MKCEQVREMISLYIDNELSKEEKIEFEKHIKGCKECYDEYLSILEVVKSINSIEELPLPEGFRDDLRIKLEENQRANKNMRFKGISKWTSVAAILVVGVIFLSAIFIGQYSPFNLMNSRSSMDSAESIEESGMVGTAQPSYTSDFAQDGAVEMEDELAQNTTPEEAQAIQEGVDGESIVLNNENMQEKIIYSANMTLQVKEYDKTYESLLQYVKDIDGFVQSSSSHNPEYNASRNGQHIREGYIFIRIPSKSFEDAIDVIEEMGNVRNKQISGENITSQYRDIEVELNNLEVQEERIVEIMKSADKVEDILEIERELNRIRTEINRRKTTLKNWDQLVDYSSIEINIREEKISTSNIQGSPFEEMGLKIQKGFIQSINIIVDGIAKLIVFIAKATPFILILLVLGLIFKKWLWERVKKK